MMKFTLPPTKKITLVLVFVTLLAFTLGSLPVKANSTAAVPPFSQDWTNTTLITTSDDWSGVNSIVGYRGDGLTGGTGTDPQTILAGDDPGVVDVNANQSNPNTFATGGVAEFDGIPNPTIALNGSGTADAPYIKIFLATTGLNNVRIAYDVRDLDSSTDNAIQQVALHYRIGSSGNFTNVPAAYIADATTGPGLATLVTSVDVALPAAVNDQPLVELRIMTSNAVGNDEWIGIDNISVTANYPPTGFSLSPNSVLENRPSGTTVGALSATDANGSDTHTYALVSSPSCVGNGADNSNFSITGNTLRTAAPFDYETRSNYVVCLQVTDNNGLSYTGDRAVTVGNVRDGVSDPSLPSTGFPMGQMTNIPIQPADRAYASYSDLQLEIPKLAVSASIVGVPFSDNGWDVTWLGKDVGWLNGTAFPTWAGNSVITGHVWDAYNQPGIFYNLKNLRYGDRIKIHAFGQ
ncbi:MAG: sortase, partial [Anaerolineales bacterium]